MIDSGDLALAIKKAVETEREACARIAEHGCLVPPDGGSPTEAEKEMCDGIAKAIRDRGNEAKFANGLTVKEYWRIRREMQS